MSAHHRNWKKLLLKAIKGPVSVKDPALIRELRKVFPKLKVPKGGGKLQLHSQSQMVAAPVSKYTGATDFEYAADEYIVEHGKEPWLYHYSGYAFVEIFRYLKEMKRINIQREFDTGEFSAWYQITLAMRNRYLDRLHSSNFKKAEIRGWVWENVMLAGPEENDRNQIELFTKAIIAGIRIIYKYMKRVDGEHIVLWHIG